jgi:hypothetical protein
VRLKRLEPSAEIPNSRRHGARAGLVTNEVVRRARMRLGENRYNVLTNNCEHFCEWRVRGEHRSYQVDDIIARLARTGGSGGPVVIPATRLRPSGLDCITIPMRYWE